MDTHPLTSPPVISSSQRTSARCASTRGALVRLLLAAALATALLPAAAQDNVTTESTTTVSSTPASMATSAAGTGFDATAGDLRSAPALAPGEYLWTPEASPAGPLVVVVSLPEQRAHVYRNGVRIGLSTISSGKPGNETPTGTFPILQKNPDHRSNPYHGTPKPFMHPRTWAPIPLHAGRIPGYPASHGCVRLPREFAELLFQATEHGSVVVIADEASPGMAVVSPGERAPVDAYTGLELSTVTASASASLSSEPVQRASVPAALADTTTTVEADPARRLPTAAAGALQAGSATASLE